MTELKLKVQKDKDHEIKACLQPDRVHQSVPIVSQKSSLAELMISLPSPMAHLLQPIIFYLTSRLLPYWERRSYVERDNVQVVCTTKSKNMTSLYHGQRSGFGLIEETGQAHYFSNEKIDYPESSRRHGGKRFRCHLPRIQAYLGSVREAACSFRMFLSDIRVRSINHTQFLLHFRFPAVEI